MDVALRWGANIRAPITSQHCPTGKPHGCGMQVAMDQGEVCCRGRCVAVGRLSSPGSAHHPSWIVVCRNSSDAHSHYYRLIASVSATDARHEFVLIQRTIRTLFTFARVIQSVDAATKWVACVWRTDAPGVDDPIPYRIWLEARTTLLAPRVARRSSRASSIRPSFTSARWMRFVRVISLYS